MKRSLIKKLAYILLAAAISASALFSLEKLPATAAGTTKEQVDAAEKKKAEKEQELAAAQQNLAVTKASLVGLESQKNTYQGQMNILNGNLTLVADNLAVLENSIELKQMDIDDTTKALEEAKQTRIDQYEAMKTRIRFLYEKGSDGYIDILFSAKNFGELINYADYIEALSAYDRYMLEEYTKTEARISEEEKILEQEMADLEEMHAQVKAEQEKVTGLINDTAEHIAITAENINMTQAAADAFEDQVDQKEAEAKAAAAEYAAIKAKYEEELRLSRLAAQSAWRDISEVTFEDGDRYLLANLIYCEAGGEPYEGQIAVGAVVINRVLSSRYPDTVTGVIYQHAQFSPVGSGRLSLALAENRATASCYNAADAAMSGRTNVGNCVYFRTIIPGLDGIFIGGHVFY
ncbi:MAG: cell wall hydrolase [Lachnospiraceae bacterium]|nr:cell wall hydrolase [Lachnospiraceae bacterium]